MKKIILILVILGFQTQTQAQTPCDSVGFNGSSNFFSVWTLQPNAIVELWMTTDKNGNILSRDSLTLTHYVSLEGFGVNDTIITCIYADHGDSSHSLTHLICCITFMFNGTSWSRLYNSTGVRECHSNTIKQSKIYDILGRELEEVPRNRLYIKNSKIYLLNF